MTTYLEKGSGNRYTLTAADSDAAREEALAEAAPEAPAEEIDATPAAIKHAEEKNVDLSKVTGTGKDGRVTADDVDAAAADQAAEAAAENEGFAGLSTKDV